MQEYYNLVSLICLCTFHFSEVSTYHGIFEHLLLAVRGLLNRNFSWFLCRKCCRYSIRGCHSRLDNWCSLQVKPFPLDICLLHGSILS